jgi:prepilin-type N-terminal cleavage/methylation domain-containing protein
MFYRDDQGFSLLEMMMVVALLGVLTVIAVPMSGNTIKYLKLSGDARELANIAAVAKMRAAAKFTQARVFIDRNGRAFRVETFRKADPTASPAILAGWETEGGLTSLSNTVVFGYGTVTTPPPNTQTTIAQSPECLDAASPPAPIANTSCIIFNSRGIPIDATGSPTGLNAIYVNDGIGVYGITIAATGFIRTWQTNYQTTPSWMQQ